LYLLVVEQQTGSGESMVWRVDPDPLPVQPGSSRQQAQDAALHLARTFRPNHPWNQGERVVLRLSPDSYLVIVPGATKTFHFRVSVAELMS
jgi:sarcosine oxidase gamma subunit